jgi:hypothetical protein
MARQQYQESSERKGGLNERPSVPRPDIAPKPQRPVGETLSTAQLEGRVNLQALKDRIKALEALAEFLRHDIACIRTHWGGGRPKADGSYEEKYGGTWYMTTPEDRRPKCNCGLDEAYAKAFPEVKP